MEDSNHGSKMGPKQCKLAKEAHTLLCAIEKNIENSDHSTNSSRAELLKYLAFAKVSALRWALESADD